MKHGHKNYSLLVIAFITLCICGMMAGQLPNLPSIPGDVTKKIPSLKDLLEGEEPLTTSLSDAVTEIPFLDDFDPQDFRSMTGLTRTAVGAFVLDDPGLYAFICESFCLRSGTYAPTEGNGYLYAPFKGPKAAIIQKVLRGAYTHPEISHRDIQVLLWAIIARTKISDMPREKQILAAKLLSPKEILDLNGGALGLIPEDQRDKIFTGVSPQLRSILEAEADLRELLGKPSATYEELEQVAVLHGIAPEGEGSRNVPKGRWSYHPDGYFLRYFPASYMETEVQLYVPEVFKIIRDERGRITTVVDKKNNSIKFEYDDAVASLAVPGDPELRGYRFHKIRFLKHVEIMPEVILVVMDSLVKVEWTFVGVPSGKGKAAGSALYAGAEDRYKNILTHKKYLEGSVLKRRPGEDIKNLIDLAHLSMAMKEIVSAYPQELHVWVEDHCYMLKKAWQYDYGKHSGGYQWGSVPAQGLRYGMAAPLRNFPFLLASIGPLAHDWIIALIGQTDKDKPKYDPAENIVTPGNTCNQRLGKCGRIGNTQDCKSMKKDLSFEILVLQAFQDQGLLDEAKRRGLDGFEYNRAVEKYVAHSYNNGQSMSYSDLTDAEQVALFQQGPSGLEAAGSTSASDCGARLEWDLATYQREYGAEAGIKLYNAHWAHEKYHEKSCKEKTKTNPDGYIEYLEDPDNYSAEEIGAYTKSIEEKQRGLENMNCE